jgi:hypothetical protein
MRSAIKFRSLTDSEPAKWVYGYYARNVFGDHIIITQDYNQDGSVRRTDTFIVLPETVGQWTGMVDKNEKEIWEGDRVKRRVWLVEGRDYMDYNLTVKRNEWCFALFIHDKQVWGLNPSTARECEVIGSIHSPATTNS